MGYSLLLATLEAAKINIWVIQQLFTQLTYFHCRTRGPKMKKKYVTDYIKCFVPFLRIETVDACGRDISGSILTLPINYFLSSFAAFWH